VVALLPAPAELAAVPPLQVVAQLPLLVQLPQVLVLLAKDVVLREQLLPRAQLLLLVQPQLLAQAPREAAALLAVRVDVAVQLLTRSFSAAMAEILPSPGPPMYVPAPRSRWKPRRRPCPLT
jgi:hypothetical protein